MNIKTVTVTTLLAASFALPAFAQADNKPKPTREQRSERLIRAIDINGDGKLSRDEVMTRLNDTFKTVDANSDGKLTKAEIEGQREHIRKANRAYRQAVRSGEIERGAYDAKFVRVNRLPAATVKRFDRIDANKDGSLSKAELERAADFIFKRRDKDGDGFVTKADLVARRT